MAATSSSLWNQRSTKTRSLRQDENQRLVVTPYGSGLIVRTRPHDKMHEIHLLEWEVAASNSSKIRPVLYSPENFPSVRPRVDDDVVCAFGRGRVVEIKQQDCENSTCAVVELDSWRLEGRSTVTCFLGLDSVSVVRKKTLSEMNAWERVRHAKSLKQEATKLFANKHYEQALERYARAVDAVRHVQHSSQSDNHTRADLVLVMITCCNNASVCCSHLSNYTTASNYAQNALVLLDALYEKRGLKIHSILQKEGYSDNKLFGEWRVKSFILISKALMERGEYAQALQCLKQAHEVIVKYTAAKDDSSEDTIRKSIQNLRSQDKDVKRLHTTCLQKKREERKKEKERAKAMFASPSKEKKTVNKKAATDKAPIVTPSPVPAKKVVAETETSILDEIEETEDKVEALSSSNHKSVSFAEDIVREQVYDDEDEDELPWYDEHKEALILSAVAGLAAALSVVFLRSRKY